MDGVMVIHRTFWEVQFPGAMAVGRCRAQSAPGLRNGPEESLKISTLARRESWDDSTVDGDDTDFEIRSECSSAFSPKSCATLCHEDSVAESRHVFPSNNAQQIPPGVFLACAPSILKSRRGTRFMAIAGPEQPQVHLVAGFRTTLILQDLPRFCNQDLLLTKLTAEGCGQSVDFVYLPHNFKKDQSFGYAIVNFATAAFAQTALERFDGLPMGENCLMASWSSSIQGLDALIRRYRNNAVMHPEVPTVHRPLLFSKGLSVPFPQPTEDLMHAASKLLKSLKRSMQTL